MTRQRKTTHEGVPVRWAGGKRDSALWLNWPDAFGGESTLMAELLTTGRWDARTKRWLFNGTRYLSEAALRKAMLAAMMRHIEDGPSGLPEGLGRMQRSLGDRS